MERKKLNLNGEIRSPFDTPHSNCHAKKKKPNVN